MSKTITIFEEIQSEIAFVEEVIENNGRCNISKRIMARSVFSGIESIASSLLEFSKSLRSEQILNSMMGENNHEGIHRGFFEVCALNDMSYQINDKGEINTSPLKTNLKSKILFLLKVLGKALDNEFDPKKVEGWDVFLKGIKIRNRITHPKSLEDLEISDEEYDIIINSLKWVVMCHYKACKGMDYNSK